MKLRARYQKRTVVVRLEEGPDGLCKVLHLRQSAREAFNLQSDEFELSLNGTDPVADISNDSELSDIGIVPGDLVFLLVPQSQQGEASNHQPASQNISSNHQASSHISSTNQVPSHISSTNQQAHSNVPASITVKDIVKMEVDGQEGENSSSINSDRKSDFQHSKHSESDTMPMDTSAMKKHLETVGLIGLEDGAGLSDPEVNRYLQMPMLCRESTPAQVPLTLSLVYSSAKIANRNEALCVVVHVLMKETGLQTKDHAWSNESASTSSRDSDDTGMCLPAGWKEKQGAFHMSYCLPGHEHMTCKLTLMPLGPVIMVYGSVDTTTNIACQLQVNPADYVKNVSEVAENTYQNLDRLSRLFKDKISQPLIDLLQQEAGLPCSVGFTNLLTELKVMILQNLDAHSLVRVSRTCRDLNRVSKDSVLWRRLYLRDFGSKRLLSKSSVHWFSDIKYNSKRSQMSLAQDWYKLYKEMYLLRKRMREQFSHMTMVVPPFINRPNPLHPFAPFQPGIIGGDYDINPFFSVDPGTLDYDSSSLIPNPRFDPIRPLPDHRFYFRGRGNRDRSFRPRFSSGGSAFIKMF